MSVFDISVLAIILISGFIGYFRGFVRELLGIFSWIGALFLTYFLWTYPLNLISQYIQTFWLACVVSALAVFIITLITFTALTYTVSSFVKESAAKGTDRSLGFLYGLFRGTAILAILAYIASKTIFKDERDVWLPAHESFFYQNAIVWVKKAIDATPQTSIEKAKSTFESVLEKIETNAPSEVKEKKEEPANVISDTVTKEVF